jgi:hypothetical protein
MKPLTRGLITSLFWLGLALGFTGALANFLPDQHEAALPGSARDVTR